MYTVYGLTADLLAGFTGDYGATLSSTQQGTLQNNLGLGVNSIVNFQSLSLTRNTLLNPGVSFLLNVNYTGQGGVGDTYFAIRGTVNDTGSTVVSGGEHLCGVTGTMADGVNNYHYGIGVEGKVQGFGKAGAYIGLSASCFYQGSTFAGTLYGGTCSSLQITSDGTTPLNQGTAIGWYVPPIIGGAAKYAFLGNNDLLMIGGRVMGASPGNTAQAILQHDGTNGYFQSNLGNAIFDSSVGSFVIIGNNNVGMVPITNAKALGIATLGWQGYFTGGTAQNLAASVTPANNSDLVHQLTSNTSLTFKVKGSDGTVRSASLTLA